MVSRFLVTTAIEKTWPNNKEPILFLGEWCKLYNKKKTWKKFDSIVQPYHWDNREKLYKDYLYLQDLFEILLSELSVKLNDIHNVSYSMRYWRILIGPWLGYFTQMLFDRWAMLQYSFRDNQISGLRVLGHNPDQFIPNDMKAFVTLFQTDVWNELIYSQILDWMKIPVKKINVKYSEQQINKNNCSLNLKYRLKHSLFQTISFLSFIFSRDDDYFFMSSYLSLHQDLMLQIKLGQIPKLWRSFDLPELTFDLNQRQWTMPTKHNDNNFSNLLRTLIPKHIPKAYLEGYENLSSATKNLSWPKTPKAIFTSNSFVSDDIFKIWLAEKTEIGIPLITNQHGGNYGVAKWSSAEDHQIAISDHFLSWGWKEKNQSKIIPVGNFKVFGNSYKANKKGVAMLIEMSIPRQSYSMYSVPVAAGQWQDYFNNQLRFVRNLPIDLRDQLIIRLYPSDYGHSQKKRWQLSFPSIQLDEGIQSLDSQVKKTRLFISTYNATTYLELMALNLPTIIFWNPNHWELRDSAIPYFKKLKLVGIFHETPESAAKQMIKVWDNISDWWESSRTQLVRKEFCEKYSNIPENPLETLTKIFRDIKNFA